MEWREGREELKKILRLGQRPSLLMLKQQYFLGPPVPEGWCGSAPRMTKKLGWALPPPEGVKGQRPSSQVNSMKALF